MATLSADDELLIILLRNLQNAAATFGAGTAPYESIRATVEEHLLDMRSRGIPTNVTMARKSHTQESQQDSSDDILLPAAFANLTIRPKSDLPNTR